MNAEAFHKQSVVLRRKTGENASGEPCFAPDEAVACRFEQAGRLVLRRDGKSVLSSAVVYTKADIREGDHILCEGKSYPVLGVSRAVGLSGKFVQNEAFLGGARADGKRLVVRN